MTINKNLATHIAAMCVMLGGALQCSADYTTWLGGDGNWGDETKWSRGIPPSDPPGQIYFETTGEPYTVTLDRDVECSMILVKSPGSGVATAPITLAGSGTITCHNQAANCFEIQNKASFVLDGPTIVFSDAAATSFIGGDFEMKSGSFSQGYCMYITGSNSHFKVSGGYVYSPRLKLTEVPYASYEQTGGYAWFPSFETTTTNTIAMTGGIFRRTSLSVRKGVADFRGMTNIVDRLLFKGGLAAENIAHYYGPYVAVKTDLDPGDSTDSYMGFPVGITLGSIDNWKWDRRPKSYIRERIHIDTADFFDRTASHTVKISTTMTLNYPFDFAAYGGGTFEFRVGGEFMPQRLDAFTLGEGTTMTMVRTQKDYHRNNKFVVQRLKLGADSNLSLMMKYNSIESTDTAEIGEGATLNMHIYTAETEDSCNYNWNRYLALCAGPTGSVENLTVNLTGDGTDGWTVRKLMNCVWIDNGATDMSPTTSSAAEWCGGSGGNLSTAANWSTGSAPASLVNGNNNVQFKTMQGVVTNDVDDAHLLQVIVSSTCGPILMRGKPIKVRRENSRSSASAIHHYSMFPLVFENDVTAPSTSTNFNVIGGDTYPSYVAFMGKLTVGSPVFDVCGHILVGGEATANSILMNIKLGSSRNTMLEILSGGSMTVSSQSNAFNKASYVSFRVNEGGALSFTGGTFDNRLASTHRVFGLMDIGVPLITTTNLSFFGSGRLDVASTKSSAKAAKLIIGEGLRLYPHSWATLTTDGEGPLTIYAETHATIGAKADWTYGPAAGVTTATTPAERALVTEAVYTPLTIDTTDPDTGAGHTITFADPILAAGDVEVKGVGAVCFASGEDSFGGKLSFDGQVTLALNDAQRRAALAGWSDILTAAKINGLPKVAEGVKVRLADNGDGTQSLQLRISGGLRVVIQ